MATTDPQTGYAPVNGLRMYYEIHGTGRPLLLLHGGLDTIDTCFGTALPALAKSRQAVPVELQGHGHTADIDRPLRYEQLADDIAALIAHLGFDAADVFGFSVGGGDVISGFWVIESPDIAAVAWVQRIPTATYGKVEIRPLVEFPAS